MSDQTARKAAFPAACLSCGARMSEPVSFCPHCGARAALAPVAGASGGASRASQASAAHPAAATHFEPPVRSFAPTDFDGDLDAPWADSSASPSAPPEDEPDRKPRVPAFLRFSQWGLKGGIGLLLGAFVVLYGGVTALHRYDQPSVSPGSAEGISKSTNGSITSNELSDPNLAGSANNERGALTPTAPVQGAQASTLGTATHNANAGVSQEHPTSRAGTGPSRHRVRGRAHGHARFHPHAYVKRRHPRPPDNLYMHADVQPQPRSIQSDTRLARLRYIPNAFRII